MFYTVPTLLSRCHSETSFDFININTDLLAALTMTHVNTTSAPKYRVPQWMMPLPLLQTLMLGPSGFITFIILKKGVEYKSDHTVARKRRAPQKAQ